MVWIMLSDSIFSPCWLTSFFKETHLFWMWLMIGQMFGWSCFSLIEILLLFSQKCCCSLNKIGHVQGKFKSLTTKHNSFCKSQWNTRWAFTQKHDIFTCEKITVAMATQYIAPFAPKKIKVKWFCISLVFI